jgi:hypothetical protein
MVTRANRCWLRPMSVAIGLGIVSVMPFAGAFAVERNIDTRSDRAVRNSQTGLESTMKKLRKQEAQKNAKKKAPTNPTQP